MTNEANNRIFIAGASGVVGVRLCRLLVADGYAVTGTTRSPEKRDMLAALGVTPVIMDIFDADAVRRAVVDAAPAIVIHQLTDLPDALDPTKMADALVRNARIREVGTRHLVDAAIAAGASRLIAQSISFAYAPGPMPYTEESPLNVDAHDDAGGRSARALSSLERQVLSAPFVGIILRYGKFYGPGTGFDTPPTGGPVHVDAAADAARLAVTRGAAGIYNIAEEDGTVSSRKAITELGWTPTFRID
jgi:nucleoside-diphosphate-sugar epimerase